MCRLKLLLPQSEVQDVRQPSSELRPTMTDRANQSIKRNRDTTKERCKVEDLDSDSCSGSDDTIGEFISSEDISQSEKARTFSKSTDNGKALLGSRHLGLPPMLSMRCSSAGGQQTSAAAKIRVGEMECVSGGSSAQRSSGSVTVGSLQQTSLELSEEELAVADKAGRGVANTESGTWEQPDLEKESRKWDNRGKSTTVSKKHDLLQPSLDLSLKDLSSSSPHLKDRKRDDGGSGISDERLHEAQSLSQPSLDLKKGSDGLMRSDEGGKIKLPVDEEEWHLTFDGTSEDEDYSLGDDEVVESRTVNVGRETDCRESENVNTKDGQRDHQLTPKVGSTTSVTPSTKRHKTSKERKRTIRERTKKPHQDREHRHRRAQQTDLSTPVELDMIATVTPRKLFHKRCKSAEDKKVSQNSEKKSRKSGRDRDLKLSKEAAVVIIDLTQEDEVMHTKTGSTCTEIDDVSKNTCKGNSPTQGQPHPLSLISTPDHQLKTSDHQLTETNISRNLNDSEADSDITICEEGSGHCSILYSPSYLPPTPGRENVTSILNRKSIAFSEYMDTFLL